MSHSARLIDIEGLSGLSREIAEGNDGAIIRRTDTGAVVHSIETDGAHWLMDDLERATKRPGEYRLPNAEERRLLSVHGKANPFAKRTFKLDTAHKLAQQHPEVARVLIERAGSGAADMPSIRQLAGML